MHVSISYKESKIRNFKLQLSVIGAVIYENNDSNIFLESNPLNVIILGQRSHCSMNKTTVYVFILAKHVQIL